MKQKKEKRMSKPELYFQDLKNFRFKDIKDRITTQVEDFRSYHTNYGETISLFVAIKREIEQQFRSRIVLPIIITYNNTRRVLDYLPVIWNEADFQAEGMWDLLAVKYRRLYDVLKDGPAVLDKSKAADIEILLILIDKIRRDDYDFKDFQLELAEKEKDEKFVFELIRKNYRSWWD
jgi:hypothetical protein